MYTNVHIAASIVMENRNNSKCHQINKNTPFPYKGMLSDDIRGYSTDSATMWMNLDNLMPREGKTVTEQL